MSPHVFVGADVGGTKIGLNAIGPDRKPLSATWLEVESRSAIGPRATVEQIVAGVRGLLDKLALSSDAVAAVGVDSPGPADINGRIERSANMHPDWEGFQLRDQVQQALTQAFGRGIPVTYENDCNAAALWESHVGSPDGSEVMALLAPGTGLGGGIVIQGRLLRGARGMAGELGHVEIVHPPFTPGAQTPRCGCGLPFCAETYVSMAALGRILPIALAQEKWRDHPLLTAIPGGSPEVWKKRAYQVRSLAANGDELCQAIFDWQCDALGKLCRQVAHAIDPHRIVIGGGFIEGGAELTNRVMRLTRESFARNALKSFTDHVKIVPAAAGDQAGCLGAALSAWERVQAK
jgi:predicted NBD/HSP70 family sugar kinase